MVESVFFVFTKIPPSCFILYPRVVPCILPLKVSTALNERFFSIVFDARIICRSLFPLVTPPPISHRGLGIWRTFQNASFSQGPSLLRVLCRLASSLVFSDFVQTVLATDQLPVPPLVPLCVLALSITLPGRCVLPNSPSAQIPLQGSWSGSKTPAFPPWWKPTSPFFFFFANHPSNFFSFLMSPSPPPPPQEDFSLRYIICRFC